jgi:hypothetical protein
VQQAGKVLTLRNSLNNSLAKFTEAHERDGTVDIDSARDVFQQSIDILSDIGADIGGSKGLYVHKRKTTDLQRESRNVLTDVTNTIGGPNGQLPATTPTTSVRHNTRSQSSSENNKRTPSQSNNSNNKSHKKKARVTTPANRRTSTRKRSRATDTPKTLFVPRQAAQYPTPTPDGAAATPLQIVEVLAELGRSANVTMDDWFAKGLLKAKKSTIYAWLSN